MTARPRRGDGADHRLVVYGTLRPGRENHALVAGLGRWERTTIVGWMGSWGRYPAFVPDPNGERIEADLVVGEALERSWPELDAFEGPGYRRVVLTVDTIDGPLEASCYVAADRADALGARRAVVDEHAGDA
jgi:gamma-glutamylcyclotransferase (GGCT)/AIG2-like uncharacterized protein YtfP